MRRKTLTLPVALLMFAVLSTSCGNGGPKVSVHVDGSSTVQPVSEAMAEEYMNANPEVGVTVSASGTGGGIKKFAAGEIPIAGASRPMKPEEIELCKKNGIEFIEVPVALDGLSVVINPENDFVSDLTLEELNKIWKKDSNVKTWADVRPGWPAEEIMLYGPGTDSGTFDFFTEHVNGEEGNSRTDYQPSEDDKVLVQGVAGDRYALGYFGLAYYEENKDKLKLVRISGITPTVETVADGSYPLSRPLYIYVNKKALQSKPAVAGLVKFYLEAGKDIVPQTGYIALPDEATAKVLAHIEEGTTGRAEDLLKAQTE